MTAHGPSIVVSIKDGEVSRVPLTDRQVSKREADETRVADEAVATRARRKLLADLDRAEETEAGKADPDLAVLTKIVTVRRLAQRRVAVPDALRAAALAPIN